MLEIDQQVLQQLQQAQHLRSAEAQQRTQQLPQPQQQQQKQQRQQAGLLQQQMANARRATAQELEELSAEEATAE